MADEEKTEDKSKKSGNMLMIILLVLVVLLLGAVGFIGYYIMTKEDVAPSGATQKTEQVQESSENSKTYDAQIKDLVLNITDAKGREKLMKLSFTVKSTAPSIQKIFEDNNAEIVDTVISLISARTSEELLTIGGKTLLKEEMLNNINTIVNEAISSSPDIYPEAKKNNVKKLFFTSFVIR
jgi:flagellar FliL protein